MGELNFNVYFERMFYEWVGMALSHAFDVEIIIFDSDEELSKRDCFLCGIGYTKHNDFL